LTRNIIHTNLKRSNHDHGTSQKRIHTAADFAAAKITPRNPQAIAQRRENLHKKKEQHERRDMLRLEIQSVVNDAYFSRKKRGENVDDDLFLVANGINPETGEPFDRVDGKIGLRYDAHGIAKTDQVNCLFTLLEKGIEPGKDFHTAPFEVPDDMRAALGAAFGTAGGTAYKDGIAVVVSGYGGKLNEDGIKHVFVNDVYADIREPLQKLFPQYQVHLLSEQKHVLEGEATLAHQ